MVAATDEERVPALPVRASSRELGHGASSSSKALLVVLFGGVALIGIGFGVAFKMGMINTTAISSVLPTHTEDHSERRSEFLDAKPAGEVSTHALAHGQVTRAPAHERPSARTTTTPGQVSQKPDQQTHRAHSTSSKDQQLNMHNVSHKHDIHGRMEHVNKSGSLNRSHHRHNHSHTNHVNSTRNSTNHVSSARNSSSANNTSHSFSHNATLNGSRNSTNNTTHNASHSTKHSPAHNATDNATQNSTHAGNVTHRHKHFACTGGSLAACQCLFACKVFGAQPSQCSGSKVDLLDALIQKALRTPSDACRGMQCIVRCAKSLRCYDDRVQKDCRNLENRSLGMAEEEHVCRYECDSDEQNVTLSQ